MRRAPTSRKYETEKGIMIPNLRQALQSFWPHSSLLVLQKFPRNRNFQAFLLLKQVQMITFNEKRAPTSIKYEAESDIIMTNFFQSLQVFWPHSSVFAVEKQPENLSFQSFFNSQRLVAAFSEMGAPKPDDIQLSKGQ